MTRELNLIIFKFLCKPWGWTILIKQKHDWFVLSETRTNILLYCYYGNNNIESATIQSFVV